MSNGRTPVSQIDNSWLHRDLEKFEQGPASEQDGSLTLMTERLQALANRLEEIEKAKTTTAFKSREDQKTRRDFTATRVRSRSEGRERS